MAKTFDQIIEAIKAKVAKTDDQEVDDKGNPIGLRNLPKTQKSLHWKLLHQRNIIDEAKDKAKKKKNQNPEIDLEPEIDDQSPVM